ncbi:ATP-binding protein [uncultured Tateyamaria sp.]|uniref:hybrid sensor histidine kinase/response regulator n=1 Tax=uncultured Tateyamaria sp. TaxID=455651 RepID=UPI00262A91C8|nr:ATP-binding protein [uncultured Tateyamaria sp.]
MTQKLNLYRLSVLAGICLLFLLLAVMVTSLVSQVQALSRAAGDNTQWSISQIDTEFANLDAMLTDQVVAGTYPEDEVRLRIDIALSRLNIINSGRSAEIFGESEQAGALIAPINTFAEQAIAVLDAPGALDDAALAQLQRDVRDVRPAVRDIALLGIRLGAERSEARRAQFASQLIRTGGVAIVLLILMAALMVVLDRLLLRAARRDAALSASSKQLSSTVAASLDAIVTADVEGRIIGFNRSAERVFGWQRDEIIGLTMEDTFIPHRMRDAHHNGMRRYLKTGQPRVVDAGRVELAALRKSGEEFPVELNITTAQDGDNVTFIAYIRDISERKINEQKLIDARDRAERTDKAKSQFLTVMSHEMRTPLNGILGVLDLLKTTALNDQQARYANIATSSSEILLEHVNEALDITRIETGNLQLNLQEFRLTALMRGVIDMFEPLAREKGLSIVLDIAPAMRGPYNADAGRIRQILTNLIGNAIKFTEQGGITVDVTGIHGPDMSSLRFAVTDTGIGIAPDQHEQVFEDFFAHAAAEGRQARGDGLGLSISRRIARAMEGDVSVKSVAGEGSTFVLSLPLKRSETVSETAPATGEDDRPSHKVCSVLIVEDNSINRSVLSDMLHSMGHSVQEAVNGADAIERANATAFDIIFMDISMPVMNGIEATRHLRSDGGRNANTLIVGLTAHGREEYREQAVDAGMDRFHTKPIRLDALHSVLSEVSAGPTSRLDSVQYPEALTEMIDLLGPDKVRSTADAFFREMTNLFDLLRTQVTMPDQATLAEAVHRAKGAASLLGQSDLEAILFDMETQARAEALQDYDSWVCRLEAEKETSQTRVNAVLQHASQTP